MARIKKYSPEQKLSSFQTLILDENPNSDYFRITEFKDTFTGGKNGFLIEGSQYLKESTEIKIELLDVEGNPIYFEPGNGIPEYYEGISKLIAVYIYNDTPIGLGKITVLGELKKYDDNGVIRDVPEQWKGTYNVKWERTFQINQLLSNEDKVRFYRRPQVKIDEIVKPIFSGNPPSVTQTGSVDGIPLVPLAGSNVSDFILPTSYRLKVNSGNKWTGSVEGEKITFDNITYSPTIEEIVNETEIIVSPPYAEDNIVTSFTNEDYSVEFPYIENVGDLATALTGSFAKISITDMKTFVGDAARVKIFRRSQNNLTDFEFVQEIQLESNELLRDITTFAKKEEPYGFFSQAVLDDYWATSSIDFDVTFNQNFLYNSAKLNSTPTNYFFTSESFDIQSGVEYTLDLNVRKETTDPNAYLKVFLSGSYNGKGVEQQIANLPSTTGILQKTNFSENIVANNFDNAELYFEVSGSDWYVNNVSLKASQETSFSPDEITFIQQVPKLLVEETFDYRFEFYDINNNYIPITVEDTKTFSGGNTNLFEKSIELTPQNLYFSFDSASNPANAVPPLTIAIDVDTTLVTGSITYTSGAYDFFGNLLSSSQYAGGIYPGYLTNWDVDGGREPFLRVQDFTGSRDDISVQFIRYTGAIEGISDTFTISRVEDGKGGVSFEIVPFRGVQIKNKESKTLEIQAVRVDGINRIDLRAGLDRGFSDAKLHLLSSSLDGITEVNTYVSLSQAIENSDFIEGVSVGTTGSGEIDYNAIFDRDAIDNELTVYLMDGPTSESILTSQILTDLKDGLNPGLITSTADQFNIKYKPREAFSFDPSQIIVTSSFQQRGSTLNPLTASLVVKPSASIQPLTELPELFVFYDTGAFDDTITVAVTNVVGDSIDSGFPGISVPYYTATQTKQLNFEFTYTEPVTSASVTANKTFFITPDGLPGQDSIVIDIDPNPISLGSNHKGEVYNYSLADTDVQVTQGDLFLINTGSGNPGTFTTTSIVPTNIVFETLVGDSTTTMSLAGFETMSALSASVQFDFNIFPYFTSSLITASKIQKFTKIVDGGGPIEVTLDPIATALNADEVGFVSNYSSATTEVFIKQDDEFFYYDEFDGGRPGTFVTESIIQRNIQFSEVSSSFKDLIASGSISSSDGEILHFKGFSGLANNQPSGSITYNFKVYPYSLTGGVAGVPRIVSKTQTFSKVNDGTAARKVSLVASSDVVVYNGDGIKVAPSGDVQLSATAINVTGSAFFTFLNNDGSTIQASSTNNTTTVGDLPATGSTKTFTVELRDGLVDGTIVDTDSVTISGVGEGATAYSAQLSNPASSITVEVDGTTFFDNAGTLIRAYKGGTELQYVEEYDEEAVDPVTFLPIGTFGQFSASVEQISTYLTQGTLGNGEAIAETSGELYASASLITNWNSPQSNTQGSIIYKIDFENGRATQFVQQSFSTVFEGATGPGIVMRGEWTGSIPYIFDQGNQRRDAVLRDVSGTTHYWATTQLVPSGSEYTDGDDVYTIEPILPSQTNPDGTYVEGTIDTNGWEYLGEQELFVAAKIAIFDESFVKNTINVGQPTTDYDTNPQIAIVGGTDEPYISIGQSNQGYGQQGAYIGVTNDGGPTGTAGTSGLLSLSGDPTEPSHNSLKWDGASLLIRGAIRQTAAGSIEPQLRGDWSQPTNYNVLDSVIHIGQSWSANTAHTSSAAGNSGPPGTGIYWDSSSGTGKTVSLAASTFVIEFDQDGNNPSPSSINVFASSSNFLDPYFKFTGGSSFFTDETSFTDGSDDDNDIVSSIDISTATMASMPLQFRVGVSEGDQSEVVSDVINVFGVKPGSDTTPNFFITPIAGGTQIKNGSGTITLQVQKADINGITNITGTSGTDPEIFSGSTVLSNTMVGITNGSAPAAQNPIIFAAAIDGTKTLLLKDSNGNVLDSITLLDVTDGLGGGSFIASNLKTHRDTSVTPNTFSPTFLSAQASFYDTSGTEYTQSVQITPSFSGGVDKMQVSSPSGNTSDITITADDGDGTSITLAGSAVATKDVVLTAVFTDPATSQTTTINETFYIVSDGVDGIDAITVINTNQAHTFPASNAGLVSSYSNSGTTIKVFEGINELSIGPAGTSPSTYKVNRYSIPAGKITSGSATANGDSLVIADYSAMDNGTDAIFVKYAITGSRSNGETFNSETTQTLTKAPAGSDAESIRLSADSQIFRIAQDGTVSPSTITITADRQNVSTNTTFTTNPTPISTGGSGDTLTISHTNFSQGGAHSSNTITATAGSVSDEITIVEVREGTDAITSILSNESHTFPANSSGTVTDFSDSGTEIKAYEGATALTFKTPDQNIVTNNNFEFAGPGNEGQGDAEITFSESDITVGQASGLQLFQTLAELGILWVHDVDDNGSFQDEGVNVASGYDYAKVKSITNTSGTNWEIALSPEYEISGDGAAGSTFDFAAFDGDSNYQIRTSNPSTLNNSEFTIEASLYKGFTGGQFPTIGGDGTTTGTIGNLTHFSTTSGFINHVLKHKKSNGDIIRIVKKQSFSKAKSGTDGQDGAAAGIVYAGNWKLTLPDGSTPTISDKLAYLAETDLVYVVKYDGSYYTCETTHRYCGTSTGGNVVGDVILFSGNYYIANKSTADDPQGEPADWDGLGTLSQITPGGTPSSGYTLWASFGAEFTSVATDILFAEDVYANRTINIGTDTGNNPVIALNSDSSSGYANPFISIGQLAASQSFGEQGIYFGYTAGNPVLSMVSGSTFFDYESGSIRLSDSSLLGSGSILEGAEIKVGRNLSVATSASNAYNFTVSTEGIVSASEAFIQGTIQGNDGRIGDWFINPLEQDGGGNQIGGQLRDSDSEIILDPNIPEIQMFKDDAKKLFIGVTGLSDIAALSDTYTFTGTDPKLVESSLTSPNDASSYSNNSSQGFDIAAGAYNFQNINYKQLTVEAPANYSATNTVSYPNYAASYTGQFHGFGPNFGTNTRRINAYLYLEVVDANNGNAVIGSKYLGATNASSNHPELNTYVAGGFGGFTSVVGDTKITLSDGTTKLAKDITINDKILAWDDNTKQFEEAVLSKIHKRNVSEIYKVTAGGKEIEVSDSHGFWKFGNEINSGEIKADSLYEKYKNGTLTDDWKINIKDNNSIKLVNVDKVEIIEKEEEVITFSVPHYVNYISNDIISHNVFGGGGGTSWVFSTIQSAYTSTGNGTLAAETGRDEVINISTATTNARIRWRLLVMTESGTTCNIAANGTVTSTDHTFVAQIGQQSTGNDVYFNNAKISTSNISLEKTNNFVEIQPGGVQVVTTDSQFIRMRRKDSATISSAADAELFRVQGGTSYFTGVANPFTTAISVDGHIRTFNDTGNGPWELGGPNTNSTTNFSKLNGMDISNMGVSLAGGPVTTTSTSYTNSSSSNYDSYVKLPGGVILQFGYIYDTSTPRTVNFPTTFPTALLSAGCSTVRSNQGGSGFNHVFNLSRSRMDVILDADRGFWWAYGK